LPPFLIGQYLSDFCALKEQVLKLTRKVLNTVESMNLKKHADVSFALAAPHQSANAGRALPAIKRGEGFLSINHSEVKRHGWYIV
jgi:hypothetical protein